MELEQVVIDELKENYPDNLNNMRMLSDFEPTLLAALVKDFIDDNVPTLADFDEEIDWNDIAEKLLIFDNSQIIG